MEAPSETAHGYGVCPNALRGAYDCDRRLGVSIQPEFADEKSILSAR